jgi:adenylate cyclase
VQDDVTRRVVQALQVSLTRTELSRREDLGKVNPEAYDYLIRGRRCLYLFNASALAEGRTMLERALALDAGFAPAYSTLAILFCTEYVNGWNNAGPDHLDRALELARRAVELDDLDPASHASLAIAQLWRRELDESARAVRRAIHLDPNMAQAYGVLGLVLDFDGQHEQAIELFEQAMRLDPQFDMWLQARGRAQFTLERFDEAEATFKRRLIRMPRSDVTRAYLASLYGHTGRTEQALRMWRELMEIHPMYSLEHLRSVMPYKDPTKFERLIDGLRQAGLIGRAP